MLHGCSQCTRYSEHTGSAESIEYCEYSQYGSAKGKNTATINNGSTRSTEPRKFQGAGNIRRVESQILLLQAVSTTQIPEVLLISMSGFDFAQAASTRGISGFSDAGTAVYFLTSSIPGFDTAGNSRTVPKLQCFRRKYYSYREYSQYLVLILSTTSIE